MVSPLLMKGDSIRIICRDPLCFDEQGRFMAKQPGEYPGPLPVRKKITAKMNLA
jgi:hypothetical protein